MTGPRPVDYLQEDEAVLEQERRHPLSAVDEWLALSVAWILLAGAGASVTYLLLPPRFVAIGQGALLVLSLAALSIAVLIHWRRATSLYTITGDRVYKAYGRFRFNLLQTTYDKVTDLHVHQSVFGRLWGYGTVRVQTAGTGLSLNGVRDPVRVKQRIESTRQDFLETLVSRAPPGATADRPGRPSLAPQPVWDGSPTPASFVGAALVAFLVLLGSLASLLTSLLLETGPFALVATVLFLVSAAMIVNRYIHFRYTRFQVTDQGTVLTRGWLSRRRVETTFSKVTDVRVDQDILGRILGYGTITINTAGSNEAPVVFRGLRDPDHVKGIIDAARRGERDDG